MTQPAFDTRHFRTVLGQFATGVAIVATRDVEDRPVGFACQSFAALSLEPPLVLFCPSKTSRTWTHVEKSATFAVSVLSRDQESVSAAFGQRTDDKFANLDWEPSPLGNPVLKSSLTWVDCSVENILDGGDHHIVIGRVHSLGDIVDGKPLIFFSGGYWAGEHPQVHQSKSELDNFLTWTGENSWL